MIAISSDDPVWTRIEADDSEPRAEALLAPMPIETFAELLQDARLIAFIGGARARAGGDATLAGMPWHLIPDMRRIVVVALRDWRNIAAPDGGALVCDAAGRARFAKSAPVGVVIELAMKVMALTTTGKIPVMTPPVVEDAEKKIVRSAEKEATDVWERLESAEDDARQLLEKKSLAPAGEPVLCRTTTSTS